jgi:hemerythrin-like metal-binding protein
MHYRDMTNLTIRGEGMAKPTTGKRTRGLYELLPFLYMAAGCAVAFSIGNFWGLFSGGLLIAAGLLVWRMRHSYRTMSAVRREQAESRRREVAKGAKLGLKELVWRKEYESGNAQIDTQHRGLFEAANTLRAAILENKPKLDLELAVDELFAEAYRHFLAEDVLLARVDNAETRVHRAMHHDLARRGKLLAEMYHRGDTTIADLFEFIITELVDGHILKHDRALFGQPR